MNKLIAVEVHTIDQPLQWIYFNKELYSVEAFNFLFCGLTVDRIHYQNFIDFMSMKPPMREHLKEYCATAIHHYIHEQYQ